MHDDEPRLQRFHWLKRAFGWTSTEGVQAKGRVSQQPGIHEGKRRESVGTTLSPAVDVYELLGHAGWTREGENDEIYSAYGLVRGKGKIDGVVFDPDARKLSAEILEFSLEAMAAYGQSDLQQAHGLESAQGSEREVVFSTTNAWAARIGDPTMHGTPVGPGLGSTTVFIEGRPALRAALDFHVCPQSHGGVPHVGGIVTPGAGSVFIDGLPAVRVGDAVLEPCGPNPIVAGAVLVEIGAPPPPVVCMMPAPAIEDLDIDVDMTVGVLAGKAELKAGAELDASKLEIAGQLGVSGIASVWQTQLTGKKRFRLSDDWSLVLGISGDIRVLTAGAKASIEGAISREKGVSFSAESGAGIGWWGGGLQVLANLERTKPP